MAWKRKYFRPSSLSWWVSVAPLLGGVVKSASVAAPELAPAVAIIDEMSGHATAAQMIQLGLLGIGLRGALQ